MTGTRVAMPEFNELPPEAAVEVLRPACASAAWQRVLVASRPFGSPAELTATSDGVLAALGWGDVEGALAADPDVAVEPVGASDEAARYEARFGVPFVIDPTGKTTDQIREALAARLANDVETEQRILRRELSAIVRVRLAKTFV